MAKTAKNSKSSDTAAVTKRGSDARPKAKAQQGKASAKGARTRTDKSKAARPGEKKGFVKFLSDVKVEMKKVTWPTRRDLAQSTVVVLVAVTIVGFYIAAVDQVFARLVSALDRVLNSI